MKQNEKVAAIVTIHDADKMSSKGRKDIANWLRRQSEFFVKYGKKLDKKFVARYVYKTK